MKIFQILFRNLIDASDSDSPFVAIKSLNLESNFITHRSGIIQIYYGSNLWLTLFVWRNNLCSS